nr:TrmH family RNA methyltransferase [Haloglycomyces albus]
MVTGHATDPFDPKTVRASTGSVFAVPVIGGLTTEKITDWARSASPNRGPITTVGADETATVDLSDHDFSGPTLLVVGNETVGMSRSWHETVDQTVRIPIGGAASSLNVSNAASILLYESIRQRGNRSH